MNPLDLFKKDSKKNSDTRRNFLRKSLLGAFGVATAVIATKEDLFAFKSKTGLIYVKQNGEVINNYKAVGASPYLGQLMCTGWNFATTGWALCNGQLLSIAENTALFSLLGTTYGGNGTTTFALPDLRGRVPMHFGQGPGLTNRDLGESSGEENHTLLLNEMPLHNHNLNVNSGIGTTSTPVGKVLAQNAEGINGYADSSNAVGNVGSVGIEGGSLPHNNMQPYIVMNWQIALQGIFPPRP